MTTLLLVRHGESAWNAEHRVQGHAGSGLTELGHQQAKATAAHLGDALARAVVVASDLVRATETAAPIAAALGAEVVLDPDLRERSFGTWEGRTVAELAEEGSDEWRRWRAGEDVATLVGGESGAQLTARVLPALQRHAEGLDEAVLVVVTHGGVIWHGLHALLDLPAMTLGGVGNASISEVLVGSRDAWLQAYNVQAHLAAADRTTFLPSELGDRQR